MTQAVREAAELGFGEFGQVFAFNIASAWVPEKAGFQLEGHLRNYYKKDGKVFDGKLYARLTNA